MWSESYLSTMSSSDDNLTENSFEHNEELDYTDGLPSQFEIKEAIGKHAFGNVLLV